LGGFRSITSCITKDLLFFWLFWTFLDFKVVSHCRLTLGYLFFYFQVAFCANNGMFRVVKTGWMICSFAMNAVFCRLGFLLTLVTSLFFVLAVHVIVHCILFWSRFFHCSCLISQLTDTLITHPLLVFRRQLSQFWFLKKINDE
jgi:hypothetical protein